MNVPAAQTTQSVTSSCSEASVPLSLRYDPASQLVHWAVAFAFDGAYLPAPQISHEVLPEVAAYLPFSHATHELVVLSR